MSASASSPRGFTFPRRRRVLAKADFERAFKNGARAADGAFKIWLRANDAGITRLGLVVGRKLGNAVRRNRLKRVLREAFRYAAPELPVGYDVICNPHVGADLRVADCVQSFRKLVELAVRRLAPRRSAEP